MKFSVNDEIERGTYNGWRVFPLIQPTADEIAAMCGIYPLLPKLLGPEVVAMVEVVKVRFHQAYTSDQLTIVLTAILSNDKVPGGWKLQVDWSPRSLETQHPDNDLSEERPLPYTGDKAHGGPYPTQLVTERFAIHIKKQICCSAEKLIASAEKLKQTATY